jgi:hypothetical protein
LLACVCVCVCVFSNSHPGRCEGSRFCTSWMDHNPILLFPPQLGWQECTTPPRWDEISWMFFPWAGLELPNLSLPCSWDDRPCATVPSYRLKWTLAD